MLELCGVTRRHEGPEVVTALPRTSLRIERGEMVGVVGKSGSGKSTLLNILGLLDRPTSGQYWIAGTDVGLLSDRERTGLRAAVFGFVFQDFQLLPDRTAMENVELGLLYRAVPREVRSERAESVLTRVGLGHRLWAVPSRMSGGERQRVAIARAMAQGVQVLLCDEPTGNLDPATADQILDQLRGLNEDGMTLVVVTHEERVAATCHRQIRLRGAPR